MDEQHLKSIRSKADQLKSILTTSTQQEKKEDSSEEEDDSSDVILPHDTVTHYHSYSILPTWHRNRKKKKKQNLMDV